MVVVTLSLMGASATVLWLRQNQWIYLADSPKASRTDVPAPDSIGLPYDELWLADFNDGAVQQHAYFIYRRSTCPGQLEPPVPTILYLHDRDGNMGHRLPIAKLLHHDLGCNVMMLSYRGFGKSTGAPDEQGLKADAQAALDFLLTHPVSNRGPILLYGHGLGGAVAIALASKNPITVAGLVVENTFLNLPKLLPALYPHARAFTALLNQIWASDKAITTLPDQLPILFLSSAKDELVPPVHMAELFTLAGGVAPQRSAPRPKTLKEWKTALAEPPPARVKPNPFREWHEFPEATHNNVSEQSGFVACWRSWIRATIGRVDPDLVARLAREHWRDYNGRESDGGMTG
ncbi:hypothetical protein GGF31_000036 [Allomyces arbusculus]|nr:hypothetical protein GGF31_000036 [Allomyces arbusculus]